MPRISTDNYDTVASWNGSQDLFVVEQPDGTKVATPAMVKQFMEAGDFEATGEVEDGHGNVLKNMAKASDVDAEIGDLSQTGLTGDSVAAQLDTAREQISGITDLVAFKDITVSTPSDSLTEAQKVKAIVEGAIPSMNVSQNFVIANISYSNAYRGQILFSRVSSGVSYGCGIYTSYYADCNVYRFALRNGAVSVVKLADAT